MTSEKKADRWLVELGERHRRVDVSSVMQRFRERLDHLAGAPSGWDRIDGLAARVLGQDVSAVVPDRGAVVAGRGDDSGDRLSEMLDGAQVLIRVLGDVVATGVGGGPNVETMTSPDRQRALEATTYLALRRCAVDRDELTVSPFSENVHAEGSVDDPIRLARQFLGDELVRPSGGDRFVLSRRVVTDYEVFLALVAEAEESHDVSEVADLLGQALSLVRSEPLVGTGRRYSWVGPLRGIVAAQVVDVAESLAEIRLAAGDWRSAERAARQGLRAFPAAERMYRRLMRSALVAGNHQALQRVFRELCDVLADPDLGGDPEDLVQPETLELLAQR